MKVLAIATLVAATVLTAGAALPATAGAAAALFGSSAVAYGVAGAAAVASATTGIISGVQGSRSAALQAQQQQLQLQGERTQAALDAQQLQLKLQRTLATQNAIFGGSNVSLSDGTPSIIAGDTYNQASIMQQRANLQSQTKQSIMGLQIQDTQQAGNAAMATGFTQAASSLISAGMTGAKIGKVPNVSVAASPLDPMYRINPMIGQ